MSIFVGLATPPGREAKENKDIYFLCAPELNDVGECPERAAGRIIFLQI